jgi:hypothetical protein
MLTKGKDRAASVALKQTVGSKIGGHDLDGRRIVVQLPPAGKRRARVLKNSTISMALIELSTSYSDIDGCGIVVKLQPVHFGASPLGVARADNTFALQRQRYPTLNQLGMDQGLNADADCEIRRSHVRALYRRHSRPPLFVDVANDGRAIHATNLTRRT